MGSGERLLEQLRSGGRGCSTAGTGSCSEQAPDFCKKSQEEVSLLPWATQAPLQTNYPYLCKRPHLTVLNSISCSSMVAQAS